MSPRVGLRQGLRTTTLEHYVVPIDQEQCFGSKELTWGSIWIWSMEKWSCVDAASIFCQILSVPTQGDISSPILGTKFQARVRSWSAKLSSMNECFGPTFRGFGHHVRSVVKHETCIRVCHEGWGYIRVQDQSNYINISSSYWPRATFGPKGFILRYILIQSMKKWSGGNVAPLSCQLLLVHTQEIFLV